MSGRTAAALAAQFRGCDADQLNGREPCRQIVGDAYGNGSLVVVYGNERSDPALHRRLGLVNKPSQILCRDTLRHPANESSAGNIFWAGWNGVSTPAHGRLTPGIGKLGLQLFALVDQRRNPLFELRHRRFQKIGSGTCPRGFGFQMPQGGLTRGRFDTPDAG